MLGKFRENINLNMNLSYSTTIYESYLARMYKFLVEKYFLILLINFSWSKIKKNVNNKSKIVNDTRNTYIWIKIPKLDN